jgi:hypothetical protein
VYQAVLFLSVLQSLIRYTPSHVIIIEILIQVFHLYKAQNSVVFCWVPDHTGNGTSEVAGNAATSDSPLEFSQAHSCDFVLSYIALFYPCDKLNGLIFRVINHAW